MIILIKTFQFRDKLFSHLSGELSDDFLVQICIRQPNVSGFITADLSASPRTRTLSTRLSVCTRSGRIYSLTVKNNIQRRLVAASVARSPGHVEYGTGLLILTRNKHAHVRCASSRQRAKTRLRFPDVFETSPIPCVLRR